MLIKQSLKSTAPLSSKKVSPAIRRLNIRLQSTVVADIWCFVISTTFQHISHISPPLPHSVDENNVSAPHRRAFPHLRSNVSLFQYYQAVSTSRCVAQADGLLGYQGVGRYCGRRYHGYLVGNEGCCWRWEGCWRSGALQGECYPGAVQDY